MTFCQTGWIVFINVTAKRSISMDSHSCFLHVFCHCQHYFLAQSQKFIAGQCKSSSRPGWGGDPAEGEGMWFRMCLRPQMLDQLEARAKENFHLATKSKWWWADTVQGSFNPEGHSGIQLSKCRADLKVAWEVGQMVWRFHLMDGNLGKMLLTVSILHVPQRPTC